MTRAMAALLLATGCANLPSDLRPADAYERGLVETVRWAWAQTREPVECAQLDQLHVADLQGDVLAGWCAAEVLSCVTSGRGLFERPRTNVFVLAGVSAADRDALIIHEVLHVQRGCWVLDAAGSPTFLDRYNRGRTDDCDPLTMQDWGHCDTDVWQHIEASAIAP